MAAQAKDGQRIMPKAVLGTIAGVTVLSSLASLALVGCRLQPHLQRLGVRLRLCRRRVCLNKCYVSVMCTIVEL